MSSLGPAELLVVLLVLALLGLPIWGAIDAASRPQHQWDAVGQSRTVWIVVLIVGIFVSPLGVIAAIVYLTTVRTKLRQAG